MRDFIIHEIQSLQTMTVRMLEDSALLTMIETVALRCVEALQSGHKILLAGNGGSAADSQHLAAELVVRLQFNRPGLAAIALTTDTSALTAIANDFGYEHVFERQLQSIGRSGDIFFAFSTSGNSPNILKALTAAHHMQITTVGFSSNTAGKMASQCDYLLKMPSLHTPKIQEAHIMIGHIICALIEEKIFGDQKSNLEKE
jgi:D-sedoheptulose 7-phosphate isomerase